MRQLLLILVGSIALLRADIVTDTYSTSVTEEDCIDSCAPFSFTVWANPTNDPGTLESATWSFTDSQQSYGGVNDLYQPIGQAYTWTTIEGDQSDILGLNVSATQYNAAITCSCREISRPGIGPSNNFEAQGQLDIGIFANTQEGVVFVPVTPFVSASFPVVDGSDFLEASLDAVADNAQLTVTYVFSPEPRGVIATLAVAFLVLLSLNAKRFV